VTAGFGSFRTLSLRSLKAAATGGVSIFSFLPPKAVDLLSDGQRE